MSNFEERLNWLEGKVNLHDAILSSTNSGFVPPSSRPVTSLSGRAIDVEEPGSFNEFVLQEEPWEDMSTDGMAITFVSEDDSCFFRS